MALDERAFFTDKPETRPASYACPRCRRTNQYSVRWIRRSKKDRLPPGADERDRAKFAKLRDHLLRLDDELVCKTCGKKFEIPSLHSLLFLDQFEGLPKDEEEEEETPPGNQPPDAAAISKSPGSAASGPGADTRGRDRRMPRRVTSPPRGWR
jgi:DNA-directed RNA polymerase subunit RPC12/RpoP